jgi:hypothetical protein
MSQQPGPWGGQPYYGQQPGGYPHSGQQPLPGYGQQPYGQPGGYPPGGGLGQPRKKSALPWILAGGGVVVVAVVVILILTLTGSDTGSPRDVAESAVSAANDEDVDAIQKLLCSDVNADESDVTEAISPAELGGTELSFELGEVTESGDTANAVVTVTMSEPPLGAPEGTPTSFDAGIDLKKEGSDWCLVGITPSDGRQ